MRTAAYKCDLKSLISIEGLSQVGLNRKNNRKNSLKDKKIKENKIRNKYLLEWSRNAELTADRAGLIVCQDIDDACNARIKLMCGLKDIPKGLTKEVFANQLEEMENSPFAKEIYKSEKKETHPFSINRLKELIYFSQSELYKKIISGVELKKL